jgi:hypothetical protein
MKNWYKIALDDNDYHEEEEFDVFRDFEDIEEELNEPKDVTIKNKSSENVDAFMNEYLSLTHETQDPHHRVWVFSQDLPYVFTVVDKADFDGEPCVWGKSIMVEQTMNNSGLVSVASKVLKQLGELADKHQVIVKLTAQPFGTNVENTLTKEQLEKWYSRFGAKDAGDGNMIRYPKYKMEPIKLKGFPKRVY